MKNSPTSPDLLALLGKIKCGRLARTALARSFDLSGSSQKILRMKWLDGLDAVMTAENAGLPAHLKSVILPNSDGAVAWFERCTEDLVSQFVERLVRLLGDAPGAELAALARTAHAGRLAEEAFAQALWQELRRQSNNLDNLLSAHHSQSDLVQEVSTRLVNWAVEHFHGTTEKELWKAAYQALRHAAVDHSRTAQAPCLPELDGELCDQEAATGRPDWAMHQEELQQRLVQLVDGLPETDRLLFRMHYLRGDSYHTLAQLVGNGESVDSMGRRIRLLLEKLKLAAARQQSRLQSTLAAAR